MLVQQSGQLADKVRWQNKQRAANGGARAGRNLKASGRAGGTARANCVGRITVLGAALAAKLGQRFEVAPTGITGRHGVSSLSGVCGSSRLVSMGWTSPGKAGSKISRQ